MPTTSSPSDPVPAADLADQIEALADTMKALIRTLPQAQRTELMNNLRLMLQTRGGAYAAMLARLR